MLHHSFYHILCIGIANFRVILGNIGIMEMKKRFDLNNKYTIYITYVF